MQPEATHLGKKSSYPQQYDPSVLVAVPRKLNRKHLGLTDSDLPFSGVDVWHAYEFSFLSKNGLPVVGILKLVYPATSDFLVESKSLKLYLNSFNMERFGETPEKGIAEIVEIIKTDLSKLLRCDVQATVFDHISMTNATGFEEYTIIEDTLAAENMTCNKYTENPELLDETGLPGELKWGTHLLRSNCKITHQPDWGSAYVYMKGDNLPTAQSFLKYIVSLRNKNHFHEEICETIFKRLSDRFQPSQLLVTCLYTRRGGIDICPVRISHKLDLPVGLCSPNILTKPTFRR
ncbi:MAG: NADPH-dependent 7-cyano-7-deazaguanine reductase QueF [Prolixibacteraceae bacterium]|nr:NADPH-dependent 7-cyano-7-deazaguanine reductase QueF [Prolixibacteraceae bacterium]